MGGPTTDDDGRMQLIHRIEYLEAELTHARKELAALSDGSQDRATSVRRDVVGKKPQVSPAKSDSPQLHGKPVQVEHDPVSHSSSLDAKLELFMSRFCGRTDVYARRWESAKTGRRGWSPATRSGFYDAKKVRAEDYEPLTKSLVARHLSGVRNARPDDTRKPLHIGLYPLRKDDTCHLLACDFDDEDWRSAAAAFADECAAAGIDVLGEISSSGNGAHVWLFFESAVPAATARRAGMTLLRRAMDKDRSIAFSSYDRLFPSQDKLPINSTGRGSFGNLIALPLQGDMRSKGTTVFANPHNWEPFDDQFAALSTTRLVSVPEVEKIAEDSVADRLGPDDAQVAEARALNSRWRSKPRREEIRALRSQLSGTEITLRRDTQLHVPTGGMPSVLLSDLKHLSSLANPEFYRKQAMRMSTFGEPRVVVRFDEDDTELRMPRGLFDDVRSRLESAGYTVRRRSSRRKRESIDVPFTGKLRPDQQTAVSEVVSHDLGVLVAPPGSGKTVMACALIAERRVATAVIVPNRELLLQWRERLGQFLSLDDKEIGQLGGGKRKTTGIVDLIMMRSISHRNADPTLLNRYGQIIIDECHGVAAPAAEAALNQVDAPRWLGLTATPYRADQLNGLIPMQCGPIRYDMAKPESVDEPPAKAEGNQKSTAPKRTFHVHRTDFTTDEPGAGGPSMPDLYAELASDESRNSLIIPEIVAAAEKGRHVLVLTNRIDHLRTLAEGIREKIPDKPPVFQLHGRLKPDERQRQRERLRKSAGSGDSFVLVAIDKVAGEGFDLPALDTLFLTMPISFKGRVVQNLGRVTRGDLTVDEVTVHDFHDSEVPVLDRMFHKRRRAIKSEGFGIAK
ncbi:DEAD/DEAH box helicase [Brevibacterium sp. CFH 10365]|uniref:DEAD/DEAH box helicase n=1 Tax=Brevibacterium sp. CFH 10365 TaxID=2585207 RepID=UPI0012663D90|nr:DEAD/DEAH box helicase [Brevibacterium sp. CFH 10365]